MSMIIARPLYVLPPPPSSSVVVAPPRRVTSALSFLVFRIRPFCIALSAFAFALHARLDVSSAASQFFDSVRDLLDPTGGPYKLTEEIPATKDIEHNWSRDGAYVRLLSNKVTIVSMVKSLGAKVDSKKKRSQTLKQDALLIFSYPSRSSATPSDSCRLWRPRARRIPRRKCDSGSWVSWMRAALLIVSTPFCWPARFS